jgi:hypothetical protein
MSDSFPPRPNFTARHAPQRRRDVIVGIRYLPSALTIYDT